ncbi:AMP-binding protein [Umezawaea beigongshangensis]|uniref:AMP-binding protein n=1 Tax=Umezawaea beigongshangensis TaxID=2780383 RepID=UPI0018F27388|nr:AMP-binding protein [Umezawaea beigongshangensis]
MPNRAFRTLAHALVHNAAHRGDQIAYEYLHDDGRVDAITYRELLTRASRAAARLRPEGASPEPALLLYPPGLDFVVAMWACLLAGVPAVPAYPPLLGASERIAARFARVLADSRATTLLADPGVLGVLTASAPDLVLPDVIALDAEGPATPPAALPGEDDVALIQYTSGSTGKPKGVVLRHRNLIANIEGIASVFGLDESARVVSWLPPYHDMGLIGFILTPVHGGFPVRLMSPVHFLKNPLTWLRQISDLGVTHTGGPNFAYDLCLRRATADLSELDLSTWRLAFNGAEPVRQRTITDFAQRFAPHGFRPEAFLPCYGLAEATLIVTGRHWSAADGVDEEGRVDCGPVIAGHDLVIVDPDTGTPVPAGTEGEIWLSGPSVSAGYWNDEADGESFAVLDGVRHLRTGDLGRLRQEHLVVTGRRKDVLIQNGVNHHAHDLESAAVEDNPLLRPTAAAFSGPDDTVVIAVELAGAGHSPEHVAEDVRARVLAGTGVRVDAVALCRPRSLPRTTSGKIQRSLARTRYLAGELTGQVVATTPAVPGPQADVIAGFLSTVFAAVCEVPACSPTDTLTALGGDSVRAAEIAGVVEDALTLPVPVELVLVAQSPKELTVRLAALWARDGVAPAEATARVRTAMARGSA